MLRRKGHLQFGELRPFGLAVGCQFQRPGFDVVDEVGTWLVGELKVPDEAALAGLEVLDRAPDRVDLLLVITRGLVVGFQEQIAQPGATVRAEDVGGEELGHAVE